jgi:16S rRNA G966 N2-methylase RsmD
VINANLDKLRLTGARVLCAEAERALANEAAAGSRYDLILVDPPYADYTAVQPALSTYLPQLLADDGLVVVETAAKTEPVLPLALRTSRRYGAARLTLFEHA